MTLVNTSFNVSTICAAHSVIEQNWTVTRFNDLHHPLQILVTSLVTTATSINLQHVCSDVVFLEVLNTAPYHCGNLNIARSTLILVLHTYRWRRTPDQYHRRRYKASEGFAYFALYLRLGLTGAIGAMKGDQTAHSAALVHRN